MSQEDQSYYRRRAEVELDHAQNATDERAGRAHRELAEAYRDRIASGTVALMRRDAG